VVLGVDLNINKTAVVSNNTFFHSRAIRNVRGRYAYNRQRLQAAGTRSAKRHLKRLSGRERRFQTDVNHCISKAIASMECDAVALEDLNVRKERRLGRKFNKMLGGWAFGQLGRFTEYKLEDRGKYYLEGPPEYTSQNCSDCGNLGIRKKHDFRCPSCGFSLDADLNAARNIAQLGIALLGRLNVNQPIVACDDAGPACSAEHSYKPPNLLGGS
jgi:IS605 OrfB family transposase